jgi:hypothetical protein
MLIRHRERQAEIHAARVLPHRLVDRVRKVGELDDLVELLRHFLGRDAEHRGVEEDVLAAGELALESRSERQAAAPPPPTAHAARSSAA